MKLEQELLSLPVAAWKPDLTLAFDWYDGPREGLCRLLVPALEFRFRLIAERFNPQDMDDRLFQLEELPAGSVERAQQALADLGRPVNRVWVPVATFPSGQSRESADEQLRQIERQARPTQIVLFTRDFETFEGCWKIDTIPADGNELFAVLNIAKKQPA